MVKKLVTIDVEDKELKKTKKSVTSKKTKTAEVKEVENYGIVEINNTSSAKKVKNKTEKGFEKNVCETVKKRVKAETSKVDDYFDFDFRANASKKTEEVSVLKMEETAKVEEVVAFDNEASRIIMVARLGSLFGCDKKMINA
ncbi:MAG: hypothetical protein IKJ33_05880 [Clostridia bacterium]|nr:hypothetical protein [Clostridia bacterium]